MNRSELNRLHTKVFEAASEVLSVLGPGLDTDIYRTCFQHELRLKGLMYKREVRFPVFYKDLKTSHDIKIELLVENHLLVDIIPDNEISALRVSALQTKLKLTGLKIGIIISFNCSNIIEGYKKIVLTS
ncbi:MAG: GxxExxY protein [Bacteroidales bacterium]|jgi:GxxExxY protein|nr:GxxExxY protein [Bacteroidales bacterium]